MLSIELTRNEISSKLSFDCKCVKKYKEDNIDNIILFWFFKNIPKYAPPLNRSLRKSAAVQERGDCLEYHPAELADSRLLPNLLT